MPLDYVTSPQTFLTALSLSAIATNGVVPGVCVCVAVSTFECVCVCVCVCVYLCLSVCLYVPCMCVHVYLCVYYV